MKISHRLLLLAHRHHSFITTPIFYANGAPHLGHLYTAVLADATHRWQILKHPEETHLLSTGTDEHGIKIYQSAKAAGKSPQDLCNEISRKFKDMFKQFNVENTHYIRTTEDHHKKAVVDIWNKLQTTGFIYKDVYKGWYSIIDECFYSDKDIEDINGKKFVKGTTTAVDWVEEENYMFRLSEFREKIKHWLINGDVIRPKHYLPLVLRYLDVNENLSISRCSKRLPWGIAVPNDNSQTIYVWLDALVSYLSVIGYPDKQLVWPPTWQILGKDIMKFHAVYWPAFLLAAGLPLPEKLFIHGHWLINNAKMSKSLGNIVDPCEAMRIYTSEGLRYFLLKQGVPYDDSNFNHTKVVNVINGDLVNNVGNLLSRGTVTKLNPLQKYPFFDLIAMDEEINNSAQPLISELDEIRDNTTHLYDQLMFYKAIEKIMGVLKQGNAFFQMHEPWKLKQGPKLSTILYLTYETVRISAVLLQPVIPLFADHALTRLGIPQSLRNIGTAVLSGGKELSVTGRKLGEDHGPFIQRLKTNNSQ